MPFILSDQRDPDDIEGSKKQWDDYQKHLHSLKSKFPKRAFEIATSDWWYCFDRPEAPHDARLLCLRMGDHQAAAYGNSYSWIEIELSSAYSGTIHLRYPVVYRYSLVQAEDSAQMHGDWRYDEFTLTKEAHLIHTIEWRDGAVWTIEASDIHHSFKPDENTNPSD
jgi:hypothetical protein